MYVKLDPKLHKQLANRGMPRDILGMRQFKFDDHVVTINSEVDGLKKKRVQKALQIESFEHALAQPFGRPYLYIIGSSPNDGKAKQAAALLMQHAVAAHLAGEARRSVLGRQLPLWHVINGSFQDKLRDSKDQVPSMLFLSNVTVDSTNVKIEKLRDILEQYNSIPRVVVVTGTDPLTFANTRLHLPVNYVLNLATARKISL